MVPQCLHGQPVLFGHVLVQERAQVIAILYAKPLAKAKPVDFIAVIKSHAEYILFGKFLHTIASFQLILFLFHLLLFFLGIYTHDFTEFRYGLGHAPAFIHCRPVIEPHDVLVGTLAEDFQQGFRAQHGQLILLPQLAEAFTKARNLCQQVTVTDAALIVHDSLCFNGRELACVVMNVFKYLIHHIRN